MLSRAPSGVYTVLGRGLRRTQSAVAYSGTGAIRVPRFGVLVDQDNGMHGAQSDGLVTLLRVIHTTSQLKQDYWRNAKRQLRYIACRNIAIKVCACVIARIVGKTLQVEICICIHVAPRQL